MYNWNYFTRSCDDFSDHSGLIKPLLIDADCVVIIRKGYIIMIRIRIPLALTIFDPVQLISFANQNFQSASDDFEGYILNATRSVDFGIPSCFAALSKYHAYESQCF